jgi:large subunit ribosomal protein L35Ae
MQGIIVQFRRGLKTYTPRHFLIQVEKTESRKDASKLVGKSVEWKSPQGTVIKGKIAAAHGNKGVVRAIFEKGLPGQSLTSKVEIK